MTPLQTAEVRAGEIRIRLSELAAEADLTPEYRSEIDTLRTEYQDVERKLAALRITDAPPAPITMRTGEGREFRELLRQGNVGDVFHAAIHGGVTGGATAELAKAFRAGNPTGSVGYADTPVPHRGGGNGIPGRHRCAG